MRSLFLPRSEIRQLVVGIAIVLVSGLAPDLLGSKYWSHNFQLVNIVVAAAVFQNFLMHDANQISFGQGAIFGLGAYLAAMANVSASLPWALAIAVAGGGAALGGLLFALPALRVQGYYLGFLTLSAAAVFPDLLFALDAYTNGINGILVPPGGWRENLAFGVTPLSVASIAVACLAMISHVFARHSPPGRKIRVAGASPEAAQTFGIRPGVFRSAVFVMVSVGTGIAGALYSPIIGFVTPAAFHLELSILLFLAVIVGGRGQIIGPLTGIYLLYLLPNVLLVHLADYRLLAYGALALLVMLAMPDGIVGSMLKRGGRRALAGQVALDPGRFPVPAAHVSSEKAAPAISIRGVTKTFGAVVAMDGINLDVARGTIVGLIGGNGSGKTTLLNAVSGEVIVRGRNVVRVPPATIARLGVGRTFQTPRIFASLTAWENILIGSECPLGPHDAAASRWLEQSERALSNADTETIPHGLRRTMEVLRVMLTGADILLLDEPAAGLSQEERTALSALLLRLRDESNKTILLVEHDLDLVWKIADNIAVMDAGKLVAFGTPQELMRNPVARKLFVRSLDA
jgi:branched-chain amino acid transport system permease protein